MAVALPDGWLDTSQTRTHTLTMNAALRAQVYAGTVSPQNELRIDDLYTFPGVSLYTRAAGASLSCTGLGIMQSFATVEAILEYFPGGVFTQVVLASGAGNCSPAFLTAFAVTKVVGPLRLGVTVQAGVLKYAWFADVSTVATWTIGGTLVYTLGYADPPALYGPLALQFEHPGYSTFGGPSGGAATFSQVRLSDFTANTNALAHAAVELTPSEVPFISTVNRGKAFGPHFAYTMDLDCDETSGSAVAADATWNGARTCPVAVSRSEESFFEGGSAVPPSMASTSLAIAQLADPWLSAETVRPYAADLPFRFEGNDPKDPTKTTPTDWSVGSLTISASLSVLQSATAWSVLTGAVTIGGSSTVPTFTVTTAPARVERQLLSDWRSWNGGALNVPGEEYTATKRDAYTNSATNDRWGWGLYAYLDIDLTVPTLGAGPQDLAVAATYALITAGGAIHTIERTYSPVTFPDGARSTQRIDLLFPVEFEGRPFYGERVDAVQIVGLQVGTAYTLHSLSLVTVEQAYLTLFGRASTNADGSVSQTGAVLSQDGASPMLNWSQDVLVTPTGDLDLDGFTDYRGDHENGLVVEDTVTFDRIGRAPGMFAPTLAATFTELNRMEGLTASYSAAAIDTAFTDTFGNVLGLDASGAAAPVTRASTWFLPTLPHVRLTAGTPYDVRAQLVVSAVSVPGGVVAGNLRIFARNHLGMVLEAQATDDNFQRLGSGVTVNARAYTGGAPTPGDTLLATAVTDASGFVTLPVRTGTIGGLQGSLYLTGA